MPSIEFRLAIEELEYLMIRVKNKSLRFEVVTLVIQYPHYCIKLFIIGLIVELGTTELLTEIG